MILDGRTSRILWYVTFSHGLQWLLIIDSGVLELLELSIRHWSKRNQIPSWSRSWAVRLRNLKRMTRLFDYILIFLTWEMRRNNGRALKTECCVSQKNLTAISLPFSRLNCFQDGRLLFFHRAVGARPRLSGTARLWLCTSPSYNGHMLEGIEVCCKMFKMVWGAWEKQD